MRLKRPATNALQSPSHDGRFPPLVSPRGGKFQGKFVLGGNAAVSASERLHSVSHANNRICGTHRLQTRPPSRPSPSPSLPSHAVRDRPRELARAGRTRGVTALAAFHRGSANSRCGDGDKPGRPACEIPFSHQIPIPPLRDGSVPAIPFVGGSLSGDTLVAPLSRGGGFLASALAVGRQTETMRPPRPPDRPSR